LKRPVLPGVEREFDSVGQLLKALSLPDHS